MRRSNVHAMIVLMAMLSLLASARPAIACGSCEEDDRASVYDHAIMHKALADPQRLEFIVIKVIGEWNAKMAKQVEQVLQRRPEVDATSIKMSLSQHTIGVIFKRDFDRDALIEALQQQFPRMQFALRNYEWPPKGVSS